MYSIGLLDSGIVIAESYLPYKILRKVAKATLYALKSHKNSYNSEKGMRMLSYQAACGEACDKFKLHRLWVDPIHMWGMNHRKAIKKWAKNVINKTPVQE